MELTRIALHSVPRSGSTWVGSIFDSSPNTEYRFQPLFSYTHKGQIGEEASLEEIICFFKDIRETNDSFVLQEDSKTKQHIPQFVKENPSHLVYKEVRYHNIIENLLLKDNEIKIVGIIRNPFSTINSWLKAPKEFKEELGWKIEEEWKGASKKNLNKPEEYNGYDKWKEVAILFLNFQKKYPNQFYLLSYSELLENSEHEIRKVFDFCNLEFAKQTKHFIEKSTSSTLKDKDAYSVYNSKDKDDAWKKSLPSYIKEEIINDPEFKKLNKYFKWI
tara:strand:- start:757 stop:1581 length:825 start_codon:yes stop_codon:yes gene_type:complete